MTTGAYVRIERDGKWQPIEIDELTDEELKTFAEAMEEKDGWKWTIFLAAWIRDNHLMPQQEFTDAYERGYWAALSAFGVWHDGVQYIGSPEKPIKEEFENKDQNEYYQMNLQAAWMAYNE